MLRHAALYNAMQNLEKDKGYRDLGMNGREGARVWIVNACARVFAEVHGR